MLEAEYHTRTITFAEVSTFEKIRRLHEFENTGLRILDVGCGSGLLDSELTSLGHHVVGIDAHQPSTVKGWEFTNADINALWPVSDQSFDLVICTDVPEHMYRPEHVLDESKRVLNREGKLIFGVPNHFDIRQRLRMLFGGGIVHWDNIRYGHTAWDYGHIRFFTIQELEDKFKQTGWHIDTVQFNFMGAGIVPGRYLPKVIKRWLLGKWPGLFSGKFVYLLSPVTPGRPVKYELVLQTNQGM